MIKTTRTTPRDNGRKIIQYAKIRGWKLEFCLPDNNGSYNIVLTKNDMELSVWIFKKNFRVHSILTHPKWGKKDLIRNNIQLTKVYEIIHNPRAHTGKGFYNAPEAQAKPDWAERMMKKLENVKRRT